MKSVRSWNQLISHRSWKLVCFKGFPGAGELLIRRRSRRIRRDIIIIIHINSAGHSLPSSFSLSFPLAFRHAEAILKKGKFLFFLLLRKISSRRCLFTKTKPESKFSFYFHHKITNADILTKESCPWEILFPYIRFSVANVEPENEPIDDFFFLCLYSC